LAVKVKKKKKKKKNKKEPDLIAMRRFAFTLLLTAVCRLNQLAWMQLGPHWVHPKNDAQIQSSSLGSPQLSRPLAVQCWLGGGGARVFIAIPKQAMQADPITAFTLP